MKIKEKDLKGFKYLSGLFSVLKELHSKEDHPNRKLHCDEYISLLLFYFFNPILTSLRGIQQASKLKMVQKKLKIKATSLGALSEASCVFDADLITPLIEDLAKKALPLEKDPRLKDIEQTIIAVDGTLLPALPGMLWALWINDENRAAKLHLELDVEKYIPTGAIITHGSGNEKNVLRKDFLGSDKLFLLDSGYAEYALLSEITSANSSFVIRLRDNAVWDTIKEDPLSREDKNAGVTRDMVAHLGCKKKKDDYPSPVRIIEIFHKGSSIPRRNIPSIQQKDLSD